MQLQESEVLGIFNQQFSHFQSDAPACDVCGSITVRNGNCYRCHNCGFVDGLQLNCVYNFALFAVRWKGFLRTVFLRAKKRLTSI